MRIHRAQAGEISEEPCWVIFDRCWLYTADTLFDVMCLYIAEYEDDKHLVG